MRERLVLLVNPAAGGRSALDRWPELPSTLAARGEVSVVTPRGAAMLEEIARAAALDGRTLIVAGGDGTVGRVLNAVGDLDPTIGVLPTGSGNDFCRGLGLPVDPRAAAHRLARGTPRRIDVIEVNGRRLATVGGLGLVADASALVSSLGRPGSWLRPVVRMLGSQAYLLAAGVQIFSRRQVSMPVTLDGGTADDRWRWQGDAHAVFVANQSGLGAGLRLPVAASIDDGSCEIAIVPRDRRVRLARNLTCLRSDRPVPQGALLVYRASHACIRLTAPAPMFADGDHLTESDRFRIDVRPRALKVLA